MQTRPNKLVALLLSLLLGLLPLQNLFAFDTTSMAHEMTSLMGTDSMAGHPMDELAGSDCDDCDAQSCCEQSSCSLHHCASCALNAVVSSDSCFLRHASATVHAVEQQSLPADLHSSLFRPPRS